MGAWTLMLIASFTLSATSSLLIRWPLQTSPPSTATLLIGFSGVVFVHISSGTRHARLEALALSGIRTTGDDQPRNLGAAGGIEYSEHSASVVIGTSIAGDVSNQDARRAAGAPWHYKPT